MKCDKCGEDYGIGDWPWCPHGDGRDFGEEPLEPYVDWNLTDDPEGIEIRTRGERRKIMDRNHFEYRPKAKLPGTTLFFDMGKR